MIVPVTRTPQQWQGMLVEVEAIANHVLGSSLDTPWTLGPSDWWCSERWCPIFAQGKCMGEFTSIFPDEAVHLTSLIERGVPYTKHGE